jgi:hypothetical protein
LIPTYGPHLKFLQAAVDITLDAGVDADLDIGMNISLDLHLDAALDVAVDLIMDVGVNVGVLFVWNIGNAPMPEVMGAVADERFPPLRIA